MGCCHSRIYPHTPHLSCKIARSMTIRKSTLYITKSIEYTIRLEELNNAYRMPFGSDKKDYSSPSTGTRVRRGSFMPPLDIQFNNTTTKVKRFKSSRFRKMLNNDEDSSNGSLNICR